MEQVIGIIKIALLWYCIAATLAIAIRWAIISSLREVIRTLEIHFVNGKAPKDEEK